MRPLCGEKGGTPRYQPLWREAHQDTSHVTKEAIVECSSQIELPETVAPANFTEQKNCQLKPVNPQRRGREYDGGCFKPLSFGVICYSNR